jgi:hypothetical protein
MRFKGSRLLTKVLLAVVLLSGFVVFTASDADAQRRHRGRHGRVVIVPRYYHNPFWYPGYYNQQFYYVPTHETSGQGFRDGYDDGKDDARDGKPYSPRSHQDFDDSRTSAYMNAYLRAYAEGYRQNARARLR